MSHEMIKKQQKEIDRISQSPDELLIRILSLLPDADATRSRLLSNRWKHLWAFLPNLHFVLPKLKELANKYNDSVDQTLALRGGMPIQKFFLQCSFDCNAYRVNHWLRIVTQCNVKELELKFLPDEIFNVRFFWDLFRTCNNKLVKLTLEGFSLFGMPEVEILFPCLKRMNLHCIEYFYKDSLMNMILRCPVLEELCLDRLRFDHNSHTVNLSSPSLRRLTIKGGAFADCELVIDAPKLDYLHIFACYFRYYTLMNPTSLVKAQVSSRSGSVIQLLSCVSSTKILTLTRESLLALRDIWCLNLPMFLNLVKLEIAWEWKLLLVLLNRTPNLEYLTFLDGLLPFGMEWNPPMEEAPTCLRLKMKEIFIVSRVTWVEDAIISYLLKHANILKKLTIGEVDPERRESWLNIHRVSKSCQIEFV